MAQYQKFAHAELFMVKLRGERDRMSDLLAALESDEDMSPSEIERALGQIRYALNRLKPECESSEPSLFGFLRLIPFL